MNPAHYLCPTCWGEYERCAGYFESAHAREALKNLRPLGAGDYEGEVYCCRCGQAAEPAAIFTQDGDWPCKGNHVPVEEDD